MTTVYQRKLVINLKERKILYWAKEFKVSEQDENSLNYDIKLLGRKGVLTVSALASINQLDTINKNLNNVLSMVAFNAGSKYSDFDSKTDDIEYECKKEQGDGDCKNCIVSKCSIWRVALAYLHNIGCHG